MRHFGKSDVCHWWWDNLISSHWLSRGNAASWPTNRSFRILTCYGKCNLWSNLWSSRSSLCCQGSQVHPQFLWDFLLLTVLSIEKTNIDFCFINIMEDEFEVPSFSRDWESAYQSNQPHPLIGYTERTCQDSRSWPSSSVPSRIFWLCWCILLLQNLTQQQHIFCQTISTNVSWYCSPSSSRMNHERVFSDPFWTSMGIHQGDLSERW